MVLTQVPERKAVALSDQLPCCRRHQDLPTVAGGLDARRPVGRRPQVVAVSGGSRSGVNPHPHGQRTDRVVPGRGQQRSLPGGRGRDGIRGIGEGGHQPVAEFLDDSATVGFDRLGQSAVMSGDRRLHGRAVSVPFGSGTFDICEEECDDSRWHSHS